MQQEHEEHETYSSINRVATMLYIERKAALLTLLATGLALVDLHSLKLAIGSFVIFWSISFWMTRSDARMPIIILKSLGRPSTLCAFRFK